VDETPISTFQILKPTERKQKFPIGGALTARPSTPPRTAKKKK